MANGIDERGRGSASPPQVIVERWGSGVLAFVCGAIVGAGAALLLAPKSGRETQAELRAGAKRLAEGAGEHFSNLRENLGDTYERTREEVQRRQRQAGAALQAGRTAARDVRSDLEARVAESKAAYMEALAEADEDAGAAGEESADAEGGQDEEEGAAPSSA